MDILVSITVFKQVSGDKRMTFTETWKCKKDFDKIMKFKIDWRFIIKISSNASCLDWSKPPKKCWEALEFHSFQLKCYRSSIHTIDLLLISQISRSNLAFKLPLSGDSSSTAQSKPKKTIFRSWKLFWY